MWRWASNKWNSRKKTVEELISYDSVIDLLGNMGENTNVSISGTSEECMILKKTGEIGENFADKYNVMSTASAESIARLMEAELKPYSEKYWEAIHYVYTGNGTERHYIDFWSIAPIKDSNYYIMQVKLGPHCNKYYATLDFLVESEQPKE